MQLILRIILLLATLRFCAQALIGYAFDFRAHGYPVLPLFIVGFSFWGYVKLRPRNARADAGSWDEHFGHTRIAVFLLLLALASSAFLLEWRGERAFSPEYFLHLSTLTFFQLLAPFLIAFACDRARPLVAMLGTLALLVVMVDGTLKDPEPVVAYFQEAKAYSPDVLPVDYVLPVEILPPPSAMPPTMEKRPATPAARPKLP